MTEVMTEMTEVMTEVRFTSINYLDSRLEINFLYDLCINHFQRRLKL